MTTNAGFSPEIIDLGAHAGRQSRDALRRTLALGFTAKQKADIAMLAFGAYTGEVVGLMEIANPNLAGRNSFDIAIEILTLMREVEKAQST